MEFRHEVIDPDPPGEDNVICLTVDLTGDGREDVIVGAKGGDPNLYWYEAPDWECHPISTTPSLEAGGVVADVDGDGHPDVIAGQKWDCHEAYWFEHPGDPREAWPAHLITDDYQKYHDQAFADVDDDGDPEVILLSQNAGVIVYYDVPADPAVEPWPDENRHVVTEDADDIEGVAVVDLDGDGATELVAGRNVFRRVEALDRSVDDDEREGEGWVRQRIAPDWEDERVRLQVADIDGDGDDEILLAEGELPALGERHDIYHDGRFAVCEAPDWEPRVIRDDLHCPHSLQVADFGGDGHPDVFVAESDYGGNDSPRQFVYENRGDGTFEEHLIGEGVGTHEAKAADLTGDGRLDVVGKSDTADAHVDVWYNET
jgi:hypothetical protein